MTSLRRFTDEQFSDGTTIDGDRLERALQDLERWSNDIPDGDFRNRWMQSQIIMKYLPQTQGADADLAINTGIPGNYKHAPYLPIYNGADNQNPFRIKGNSSSPWLSGYTAPTYNYFPDDTPPIYTPDVLYNNQAVWTMALAVGSDPLIIESADLIMMTDTTEYSTNWLYGSGSVAGEEGTSSDDIHLEITADNPFLPNIQQQNTILHHKYLFKASSVLFSPEKTIMDPVKDMAPAPPPAMNITYGNSLALTLSGLNIPIPPYSRLRFSLILPLLPFEPWTDKPWTKAMPTLSFNILERLTDG